MANKEHFTMDEWSAVRDAPQLVGLAVALSGASGIAGTIKETFSSSLAMVEGMKSDNELIRSVCVREELQAGQAALKTSLTQLDATDFAAAKQKLATLTLARVREAIAAVRTKAAGDLAAGRTPSPSLREARQSVVVAEHIRERRSAYKT